MQEGPLPNHFGISVSLGGLGVATLFSKSLKLGFFYFGLDFTSINWKPGPFECGRRLVL